MIKTIKKILFLTTSKIKKEGFDIFYDGLIKRAVLGVARSVNAIDILLTESFFHQRLKTDARAKHFEAGHLFRTFQYFRHFPV